MDDNKSLIPVDQIVRHITLYTKGKLKWKLETLPEEYLCKSAEELENCQKLTETDKKLRLSLSRELNRASKESDSIIIANVCKGICHPNSFLQKIDSAEKLAWMILPYQDEELRIIHQVNEATDAIESLLNLDIYIRDQNGKKIGIDHKAAELKYKAAKLIYDRKYPATQKIAYSKDNRADRGQVEDIENKIKLLEEKLKK